MSSWCCRHYVTGDATDNAEMTAGRPDHQLVIAAGQQLVIAAGQPVVIAAGQLVIAARQSH